MPTFWGLCVLSHGPKGARKVSRFGLWPLHLSTHILRPVDFAGIFTFQMVLIVERLSLAIDDRSFFLP